MNTRKGPLQLLFDDPEYSDFKIYTQNEPLKLHRCILAQSSPLIAKLKHKKTLDCMNYQSKLVQIIFGYMYGVLAYLPQSMADVNELVSIAKFLEYPHIEDKLQLVAPYRFLEYDFNNLIKLMIVNEFYSVFSIRLLVRKFVDFIQGTTEATAKSVLKTFFEIPYKHSLTIFLHLCQHNQFYWGLYYEILLSAYHKMVPRTIILRQNGAKFNAAEKVSMFQLMMLTDVPELKNKEYRGMLLSYVNLLNLEKPIEVDSFLV